MKETEWQFDGYPDLEACWLLGLSDLHQTAEPDRSVHEHRGWLSSL
jgi:hypothetical protein